MCYKGLKYGEISFFIIKNAIIRDLLTKFGTLIVITKEKIN